MPRWITKPAPIKVGEGAVTFDTFLGDIVNQPAQFGQGLAAVRAGSRILDTSAKAEDGKCFVLDEADYTKLLAALEGGQWNPAVMRALDSFAVAIEKAGTEAPTT